MLLAFLYFNPKSAFCQGYNIARGCSLCNEAEFQKCVISRILSVFLDRFFFAQNDSNVLVLCVFASFWHFKFLTQTNHFARAIAFAWA